MSFYPIAFTSIGVPPPSLLLFPESFLGPSCKVWSLISDIWSSSLPFHTRTTRVDRRVWEMKRRKTLIAIPILVLQRVNPEFYLYFACLKSGFVRIRLHYSYLSPHHQSSPPMLPSPCLACPSRDRCLEAASNYRFKKYWFVKIKFSANCENALLLRFSRRFERKLWRKNLNSAENRQVS